MPAFPSRVLIVAGALALGVAGCQTPQESLASADDLCRAQGLRPGTRNFRDCLNGNYVANRQANQQASDQVAAGVVAGAVGGALLGAAVSQPYYGRGYYRGGYYGGGYYY